MPVVTALEVHLSYLFFSPISHPRGCRFDSSQSNCSQVVYHLWLLTSRLSSLVARLSPLILVLITVAQWSGPASRTSFFGLPAPSRTGHGQHEGEQIKLAHLGRRFSILVGGFEFLIEALCDGFHYIVEAVTRLCRLLYPGFLFAFSGSVI